MAIKRSKLIDRQIRVRDSHLVVIATEGEKTEYQYFSTFGNNRLKVEVIPTPADHSSGPMHVLSRLREFKGKYDLTEDDELWLVIDVDHHKVRALSEFNKAALECGFSIAVSNPCFELWLLLHHSDIDGTPIKCAEVVEMLREALGSYNKSNINLSQFKDNRGIAIDRAKHLDSGAAWPKCPGTQVYLLVEKLLSVRPVKKRGS